jgi:hypothetical protein
MQRHTISVGSITYAIKGRDLLRKLGFKAHIERKTNMNGNVGCGYVIIAEGNRDKILNGLTSSGINVLEISSN